MNPKLQEFFHAVLKQDIPLLKKRLHEVSISDIDLALALCIDDDCRESFKVISTRLEKNSKDNGVHLQECIGENRFEILKMLIPYCDTRMCMSLPFRTAMIVENLEIAEYLIPFSDPEIVREYL